MNDNDKILSAINNIAANVPFSEETTYLGDDGLLYCSKCKEKKQSRVTLFGKERIMPCICKCEIKRIDEEKQREEALKREDQIRALRLSAFPNSNMQNWKFSNDDGTNAVLSAVARNYVENFDSFKENGKGILFYGDVGTGKSFAAACIANALIDKGIPVLMTSFPRIANTVQGMTAGRQEYYDSFQAYPLLIIDDFAAERRTEYMQEVAFNVIDARCNSGLPMIITSNLTAEEIKNPADDLSKRIFDRLLGCCHPIEIKGIDRRKQQLRNDFENTKKLLGL